ncbi:zinc finger HIT domain-containing protein 2 [Protopterus annectens]|uniref:zinc finger HIT domain-containing protein 2 n=1 Tax=Protopterus annectens TaxID=7888 RepID=UPI001CFBB222|nr:zinc finger HIT domain-containing protein 2 [Protopterus annectens]
MQSASPRIASLLKLVDDMATEKPVFTSDPQNRVEAVDYSKLPNVILPTMGTSHSTSQLLKDSRDPGVCRLCFSALGRYTCPKCNVQFCSVSCYQGKTHQSCSEKFYKDCVFQHLKLEQSSPEQRRKMEEILLRALVEQGVEEMAGGDDDKNERAEAITLEERLAGLDIEEASEDDLWGKLTEEERKEFEELLTCGKIGAVVHIWKPWWEKHDAGLVETLDPDNIVAKNELKEAGLYDLDKSIKQEAVAKSLKGTRQQKKIKMKCREAKKYGSCKENVNKCDIPPVSSKILPFCSLTSNPSPLIRFSIINVLYSYTFCLKFYNGDVTEDEIVEEFVDTVLKVSDALNSSCVIHSTAEALQLGMNAVQSGQYCSDSRVAASVILAVAHILTGENSFRRKHYTLAAISHLSSLIKKRKNLLSKEQTEDCQKLFRAHKKCDFLLSWANENESILTFLALEVQQEYRNSIETIKEVDSVKVQLQNLWGGKQPPKKKVLIQELD